MGPKQMPTAQVLVGGQPTSTDFSFLSDYEVIEATPDFVRDEENKQNANGTHRVRIQYSKRKSWDLTLEAHSGVDITTITEADEVTDGNGAAWDVLGASAKKTRGVTVVNVKLVCQTDLRAS